MPKAHAGPAYRTSERPLGRRHSRPHPHCHTGTCRAPATRRHCATVYPCRGHGQPGTGNRLDRRHAPQRRRPWPVPSRRNAPRVICRFAADGTAAGRSWGAADPGSPQRHQELLDNAAPLEELVRAGCLVQVSSKSITEPRDKAERRALRGWFRRGLVHVLGSDGHSPHRRPPLLAAAFRQVTSWVGRKAADAIGGGNASAVLDDKPLRVPDPLPPPRRFFFWPWSRG